MTKDVELAAMVPNHVNRKREIREHVRENDRNRTERTGKAEIVQRRNSAEQAKTQNEGNRDNEKRPHRAVWRLMLRMNLAEKLWHQTLAAGVEKNSRL